MHSSGVKGTLPWTRAQAALPLSGVLPEAGGPGFLDLDRVSLARQNRSGSVPTMPPFARAPLSLRFAAVAGLLLAAALGCLVWRASGPTEPVFEGRKYSSWLDHHVAASDAEPPFNSAGWRKADDVLRKIGTNGIPTLLKMIRSRDKPRLVISAWDRARRYGWIRQRYRYADSLHREAEYAFEILGTNAVSAVPGLIRIYEQNTSPSSQRYAAMALAHIGRGARAAVPTLLRDFTHTNSEVRFQAVSAAMWIGGEPEVMVPALVGVLRDANINVRWNALVGLSLMGARARPAVPEILKMTNDTGMVGTSPIRGQVELALWRIAPEKVGKPIVVEDATPLIAHGVTTDAIKFLFYGEHKTLIPAGKSVPVLAQYWNSDPRPRLTLFRDGHAPDPGDHLLGEFEVMDVGSEENVNISTLCVVADGRIILCARDNRRDMFLEIRRVDGK